MIVLVDMGSAVFQISGTHHPDQFDLVAYDRPEPSETRLRLFDLTRHELTQLAVEIEVALSRAAEEVSHESD